MTSLLETSEIWVSLHYRHKGEDYRFNLPLPRGAKFLEGLRVDFDEIEISGGYRYVLTLESLGFVEPASFELTGSLAFGDLRSVFVNGYQSWTVSRERYPGEKISSLDWPGRLLSFQNLGDARFYPYSEKKGRFHGYTYAYIRKPNRLVFLGSLDESAGFTVIGTDIHHDLFTIAKDVAGMRLDGKRILFDFVLLEGAEDEVFDRYSRLWFDRHSEEPRAAFGSRAVAWSGGDFGKFTDEKSIRRVLNECREKKIPLDYFKIDRGWQRNLGDWGEPAAGFSSGMASLADEIRGSGYSPGIWMAPFVVGMDSAVFQNHNDWLARDSRGRIRPAGRHLRLGESFYALNISLPAVREYVVHAIERIRDEWRFDLIEMDLLYAAILFPPDGMSRGEALVAAMDILSSAKSGAVYQLNGVPLSGAFGRAEYCRIAAQTTPYWEHFFHRNIHCRERASTINALRSTVGRRQLDGRFFSVDPGAFFLSRRRKIMEPKRRYTLFLLQALFGTFFCTSDDISAYKENEFRLFASLFPKIAPRIEEVVESRRTVTVRYRAQGRSYLSVSNLSERVRSFSLPEGTWFGAPGLERRASHLFGGSKHTLKPGESGNYMLLDNNDVFAGCDGHIFPGAGIAGLTAEESGWKVNIRPEVFSSFRIWIRHDGKRPALINGEEAETVETSLGERLITGIVHPPAREKTADR